MRIAITADHNGVSMKAHLVGWLSARGHEVDDCGVHDDTDVVDYPPLCVTVCRRVLAGHCDRAIVIGGAGGGEVIACNKLAGIRAALGHTVATARISRANNDANVLVLAAKVIGLDLAERVTDVWLTTDFTGGRHQRRLEQIAALERGEAIT